MNIIHIIEVLINFKIYLENLRRVFHLKVERGT